jgi:apolipoprotein D and lipocalin family protein
MVRMPELETVQHVDIARYMGIWYEIAKLPQGFEKGLVGITATYELLPSGKVRVLNQGHQNDLGGRARTAKGTAKVVDPRTNAKLKVTFFWPFYGDYWIIELGRDYEYVVVGEPSRRYLWILSRAPLMDEDVYQGLLRRAGEKGFDISRIERTPQRTEGGRS